MQIEMVILIMIVICYIIIHLVVDYESRYWYRKGYEAAARKYDPKKDTYPEDVYYLSRKSYDHEAKEAYHKMQNDNWFYYL